MEQAILQILHPPNEKTFIVFSSPLQKLWRENEMKRASAQVLSLLWWSQLSLFTSLGTCCSLINPYSKLIIYNSCFFMRTSLEEHGAKFGQNLGTK